MKLAVDVNIQKNSITGWASTDSNENIIDCVVCISRNNIFLKSTSLCVQRDDVLSAGLHPNGKCGFEFTNKDTYLIDGGIYKINFTSHDSDLIISKSILYGDQKTYIDQFINFELPRDDFSIMKESTEDLFKAGNDFLAFKKLLIRLRRGKRAHGSRGKFTGYNYPFINEDWLFFRDFVENNIYLLMEYLRPRHLWSIVDTFADYADVGEKMAALSISNILVHERFSQTYKCIYDFTEKSEKILDRQIGYWGGMSTNRLSLDDSLDVFMTRNLECFEYFPLMKKFFIYFLNKMLSEKSSVLCVNIINSEYFTNASDFYKKFLKD